MKSPATTPQRFASYCVTAAIGVGLLLGWCHLAVPAAAVTVGAAVLAWAAFAVPTAAGPIGSRPAGATVAWSLAIGPIVAVGTSLLFLRHHPQFLCGVVVAGLCVGPRRGTAARLVVAGLYAWLFFDGVAPRLGLHLPRLAAVPFARAVGLGVALPALLGVATRALGRWTLPIAGVGATALLVSVAGLFAITGSAIVDHPGELPLIALPVWLTCLATLGVTGNLPDGRGAVVALPVCLALFGVHHGAPVAAAIAIAVELSVAVGIEELKRRWRRDEI